MDETPHFSDLANSLLPRSLEPELPKAEGSPETERKPYELTAVDEPGVPVAPASAEDKKNPLLEIVEQGMDAGGGDPATRKVPHNERSTVGTIGPAIH